MTKLGYRNHSRVLAVEKIESTTSHEKAYSVLEESPGQPILRIQRIRFVEDTPFALETSYLSYAVGSGLLEPRMPDEMSIYSYIENELHIRLSRADHVIQPGLADQAISEHLDIKKGSPVLLLQGTTFSMNNKPIEYLDGIYRGDKYKLKVVITK